MEFTINHLSRVNVVFSFCFNEHPIMFPENEITSVTNIWIMFILPCEKGILSAEWRYIDVIHAKDLCYSSHREFLEMFFL